MIVKEANLSDFTKPIAAGPKTFMYVMADRRERAGSDDFSPLASKVEG